MTISNHTVDKYITSFVESYLIYKVERFDVKGKNLLVRDYKYYSVDTGLRSYLLGKKQTVIWDIYLKILFILNF